MEYYVLIQIVASWIYAHPCLVAAGTIEILPQNFKPWIEIFCIISLYQKMDFAQSIRESQNNATLRMSVVPCSLHTRGLFFDMIMICALPFFT